MNETISRNQITGDERIGFNKSDYNNLRIYKQGLTVLKAASSSTSVSHNLGYIPAFLAYAKSSGLPSGFHILSYNILDESLFNETIGVSIDTLNINFNKSGLAFDVKIYYFIFRERGK